VGCVRYKTKPCYVIFFLYVILFLMCTMRDLKMFLFPHVDIGASYLTEMPTLGHRGDTHVVMEHKVAVGGLREVERNL